MNKRPLKLFFLLLFFTSLGGFLNQETFGYAATISSSESYSREQEELIKLYKQASTFVQRQDIDSLKNQFKLTSQKMTT